MKIGSFLWEAAVQLSDKLKLPNQTRMFKSWPEKNTWLSDLGQIELMSIFQLSTYIVNSIETVLILIVQTSELPRFR